MSQPQLSVCLIVKNEEKNLPRCLKSVTGLADELIVVDTGSTDKTVAIARDFSARVFFFPWKNDFSKARNFALDHAQGEWILFLDADEELQPVAEEYWWHLIKDQNKVAYFIQIINYNQNEKNKLNSNCHSALRLFRRSDKHYYQGKIHEQILPQILKHNSLQKIDYTNIKIHHYGYLKQALAEKSKINRNKEIILSELKANPKNPFMRLNLGVEYLRSGEYKLASWNFKTARKLLDPEASYYSYLTLRLAQSLLCEGAIEEGIRILLEGIERFPDYTDLHFLLGEAYLNKGQYKKGKECFLKCLELKQPPLKYVTETGVGSDRPAFFLGKYYQDQLDIEQALNYYLMSLKYNPDNTQALENLINIILKFKNEDFFISYFQDNLTFLKQTGVEKILELIIDFYPKAVLNILINKKNILTDQLNDYYYCQALWNQNNLQQCAENLTPALNKYNYIKNSKVDSKILLKLYQLGFQLYWYHGQWKKLEEFLDNLPPEYPWPLSAISELLQGKKDLGSFIELKSLLPPLYLMVKNWLFIDYNPQLEIILDIYREINNPEANLKLAKLLYKNKRQQQALKIFISLEEEELDSESLQMLAEVSYENANYYNALDLIREATQKNKDQETNIRLNYLKYNFKNIQDYTKKALEVFPDNALFTRINNIIQREVYTLDKSTSYISLSDSKK